jgi:hypothetical protein
MLEKLIKEIITQSVPYVQTRAQALSVIYMDNRSNLTWENGDIVKADKKKPIVGSAQIEEINERYITIIQDNTGTQLKHIHLHQLVDSTRLHLDFLLSSHCFSVMWNLDGWVFVNKWPGFLWASSSCRLFWPFLYVSKDSNPVWWEGAKEVCDILAQPGLFSYDTQHHKKMILQARKCLISAKQKYEWKQNRLGQKPKPELKNQ